jgi:hypothetical protein
MSCWTCTGIIQLASIRFQCRHLKPEVLTQGDLEGTISNAQASGNLQCWIMIQSLCPWRISCPLQLSRGACVQPCNQPTNQPELIAPQAPQQHW